MATFMANPYAPRNEWLSLTTKAPGSLSFRTAMAVRAQLKMKSARFVRALKKYLSSTLVSGNVGLVPEL